MQMATKTIMAARATAIIEQISPPVAMPTAFSVFAVPQSDTAPFDRTRRFFPGTFLPVFSTCRREADIVGLLRRFSSLWNELGQSRKADQLLSCSISRCNLCLFRPVRHTALSAVPLDFYKKGGVIHAF